jgi:hypothetical protein
MFEELLADLDRANVRFVVVGGLAVVIQGYARLTADVDLKRRAARPQDALDIQHLEEIARRRHGH